MIQRVAACLQLSDANVQVLSALADQAMPSESRYGDDISRREGSRKAALQLEAPAASSDDSDDAIPIVPVPLELQVVHACCEDAVDAAVCLQRLAVWA
jgi:hypothetical protein